MPPTRVFQLAIVTALTIGFVACGSPQTTSVAPPTPDAVGAVVGTPEPKVLALLVRSRVQMTRRAGPEGAASPAPHTTDVPAR